MKIECKLKRRGGTKIANLFGQDYHFKPEGAAAAIDHPLHMEVPHVAEVTDDSAIHRLCAQIREAYAPVDADAVIPAKASKNMAQTIAADKAAQAEAQPVIIQDSNGNAVNLTALEPEVLRELAKTEFGINVHHKWADQTVIAKIVEKTRGED